MRDILTTALVATCTLTRFNCNNMVSGGRIKSKVFAVQETCSRVGYCSRRQRNTRRRAGTTHLFFPYVSCHTGIRVGAWELIHELPLLVRIIFLCLLIDSLAYTWNYRSESACNGTTTTCGKMQSYCSAIDAMRFIGIGSRETIYAA